MEINTLLSVKFFKTDSGNEPVRDWLIEELTIEEKESCWQRHQSHTNELADRDAFSKINGQRFMGSEV